jgi:type VI secretion system protein ImpK
MAGRKDNSRDRRPGRAAAPRAQRRGILETIVAGGSGRSGGGTPPPRARLVDLASEWFSTVIALKRVTLLPDADALRARALELKAKFEQEARDGGFSAADTEASVYAMVAFLDETVLNAAGPAREAWVSMPLQLQLFGQNVAGEEFFIRLDKMRRERDTRVEALEVYYCCLAFGFGGALRLLGPERLQSLLGEVERDVAAVRGTSKRALAPHAMRKDEGDDSVAAGIPVWITLAAFVVAVTLVWLLVLLVSSVAAGRAAGAIHGLLAH